MRAPTTPRPTIASTTTGISSGTAYGVLLFAKTRRSFPPTWWGKASTVCQICFVLALLLHFTGFAPLWLVTLGIWLTAAFAAVSGVDYAARFFGSSRA